jgi:hypothetical protein
MTDDDLTRRIAEAEKQRDDMRQERDEWRSRFLFLLASFWLVIFGLIEHLWRTGHFGRGD